jgi:hypothetical protein
MGAVGAKHSRTWTREDLLFGCGEPQRSSLGRPATRGGCRAKGGSVRDVSDNAGMAQNFIESGREQGFLLPPDVRDWLPADHLAWFVIDAVAQMDLSGFYAAYRADGHGRAAYEPSMMG